LTGNDWLMVNTKVPFIEHELVVINMGKAYTVKEAEEAAILNQGFIPTHDQLRNNFAQSFGDKLYSQTEFEK
jgi:hypothetical protein